MWRLKSFHKLEMLVIFYANKCEMFMIYSL